MPKTLLLADDSVTIQKVVGLSFASEDVTLITVNNGDDALVRARETRPDVVLADVVMPGRNGYEVCSAIKSDPALRHIPVLLLTGTFEAFDEERAQRSGADGHVTKPFEAQALVEQVKALMAAAKPAAPAPVPDAPEPPAAIAAEAAVDDPGAFSFDAPAVAPAGPALETPEAEPAAPVSPAPDFFDDFDDTPAPVGEVSPAVEGAQSLDLDGVMAEHELELATVAEEEDAAATDPAQESFRGSPLFGPEPELPDVPAPALEAEDPALAGTAGGPEERSDGEDSSPRALPPADRDVLPETPDDDDFGFDQAPSLQAALAAPVPAGFFEQEDDEADAVLDPGRAEGYDLDLDADDDPLAAARGEAAAPELSAPTRPEPIAPEPFAWPAEEAAAGATPALPAEPPPGAEPASFASDDPFAETSDPLSTSAVGRAGAAAGTSVPVSTPTPTPAGAAEPGGPVPDLGPMLRERIHETLEKVAWEAFSDLSDTIVRQVVERVETVAWEVIPQLAETLIREEIRKLKDEAEES